MIQNPTSAREARSADRATPGRVVLTPAGGALLLLLTSCATSAPSHEVRTRSAPPSASIALAVLAEREARPPRSQDGAWDRASAAARLLEVAPSLELAEAALDRARAGLILARSAGRPRLGLGVTGTNSDNPAQVFMGELNAGELSLAGGLGDTDPTTHLTAGLHASVLLWDGGLTGARERAAEAGVEAGRATRGSWSMGLLARLDALWFGLQQARAQVGAVEASGPAIEAALESARARQEAGAGLASEVLSLESRSWARAEALASARARVDRLERSLDLLLDLDGADSSYMRAAPVGDLPSPPSLDQLVSLARSQRPDLRALDLAVQAREAALEASGLAGGPRLAAFADGWLDGGTPAWELDRGSYRVGASLTWSLSDGGVVEAHEAEARAGLRSAQAELAMAVEAVELELLDAHVAWGRAQDARATSSRRAQAASAALEELSAGYEAGSVTLERWLGAEAEQTAARTARELADLDLAAAQARLDLALGRHPALVPASPDETDDETTEPSDTAR